MGVELCELEENQAVDKLKPARVNDGDGRGLCIHLLAGSTGDYVRC